MIAYLPISKVWKCNSIWWNETYCFQTRSCAVATETWALSLGSIFFSASQNSIILLSASILWTFFHQVSPTHQFLVVNILPSTLYLLYLTILLHSGVTVTIVGVPRIVWGGCIITPLSVKCFMLHAKGACLIRIFHWGAIYFKG